MEPTEQTRIRELEAEVSRLKGECDKLLRVNEALQGGYDSAHDEMERSIGLSVTISRNNHELKSENDSLKSENKRLRSFLENESRMTDYLSSRISKLEEVLKRRGLEIEVE